MQGLDVSRIVNVQINMSPKAVPVRNFGAMCIVGDTQGAIPLSERLRTYNNMTDVGADFSVTDPEYKAALLWFSQRPQPAELSIATMDSQGGVSSITGAQHPFDPTAWSTIADGGFSFTINGVTTEYANIDFTVTAPGMPTIQTVMMAINTVIANDGIVLSYNSSSQWVITESTVGGYQLGYASAPTVGTDISTLLGLDLLSNPDFVLGSVPETPADVTALLLGYSWYGLAFATQYPIHDQDNVTIAQIIEAASPSRMFGVTTDSSNALMPNDETHIGYKLKALGLSKTLWQFSTTSPYAVISAMARIFTTDFTANNTMITLKFKQQPLVIPELLTSTQADAITKNNGNVFVRYNNDTAIIQEGTMANGFFVDEVYGLDWLQNAVQTNYFNTLYGAKKVPQDAGGMARLSAAITNALMQAVANGLVGPGTWNADPIGSLQSGDFMPTGFYIFTPDISAQAQADREARKAPTHLVAAKLQGAIHFGGVIINVNR